MQVIKTETADGTVKSITFRSDQAETPAELRQAAKSWLATNYPALTLTQVFDRLSALEAGRITLNME